ncbi:MAG TPA: YncE family protein [Polyangia bacterium]
MGGMFVVTNFGDDTLSVLDPVARKVVGHLPVGFVPVELEGPHHLAVDPAGRYLYVNLSQNNPGSGTGPHGMHGMGSISGQLLKVDVDTGDVVSFARVDPNPGDNLISPDGKTVYVTHYNLAGFLQAAQAGDIRKGDSRLAIVDTASMTVRRFVSLCPAAHGMILSPDGNTLYASCMPDEIAILDLTKPDSEAQRVVYPGAQETAACGACPYALGLAPDGRVWIGALGQSNNSRNAIIRAYDPERGAFDPDLNLRLCGGGLFPAFVSTPGQEGHLAYLPEQGSCGDRIRIYQVGGRGKPTVEVDRIDFTPAECFNAHALHITEGGATGVLVCEGDHKRPGTIVWLDLLQRRVLSVVPVGVFPDDMEFVPHRAP